eukprot:TRINITY_DN22615_c0_g1_i1.p1 TRINITY_DN22615_c0_g1~~TRINITY_DN22615_c0_g1_i1.p1  ORF type:complete len:316 (+),score=-36.81 TRINITY_DN22615_c0_g1_i1:57-950(+)
MEPRTRFLQTLLLLVTTLLLSVGTATAMTSVVGNVFCDRCRDGHRGALDLPLSGVAVALECDGRPDALGEAKTDIIGGFSFKFEGDQDLSACGVRIVRGAPDSQCSVVSTGWQPVKLLFSLFFYRLYSVDTQSLFLQPPPSVKVSWCPSSSSPPSPALVPVPPAFVPTPPTRPAVPAPALSACPYQYWQEYTCRWKVIRPGTPLWVPFGVGTVKKFGTDMTVMDALGGRGDVFRVLAREATASLLNSYESGAGFRYNAVEVVYRFNVALQGSPREALRQAAYFRRANTVGRCSLSPC